MRAAISTMPVSNRHGRQSITPRHRAGFSPVGQVPALMFQGETDPPKTSKLKKAWTIAKRVAFGLVVSFGLFTEGAYNLFNKDPVQAFQTIHRTTRPIPQALKTQLKPFFDKAPYPIDFDQLQIVPEFLAGFKEKNHVIPGFHGTIVLSTESYEEYLHFENLPRWKQHLLTRLMAHEMTHLVQMQMMGRYNFLERISQDYLKHDNVYDTHNPTFHQLLEKMTDLKDPSLFVNPNLTLEQSAVLVETFVDDELASQSPH